MSKIKLFAKNIFDENLNKGNFIIKKTKGLQLGHAGASNEDSLSIDSKVRMARDALFKKYKDKNVTMHKKIKTDKHKTPCSPDGGMWYFNNKLICVFEAKNQQNKGNAIERWYKNYFVCKKENENVSYVTFCSGEGAYDDGTIGIALSAAHETYNEYIPEKASCFLSKDGYDDEFILSMMDSVINERILVLTNKGVFDE